MSTSIRTQLRHARDELFPREGICGRKVRYVDEAEAKRVQVARSREAGSPLRCYPCTKCAGWHLTRFPQS